MWLWLPVALAAPAEEVVVYADPFARWDDTRWLVESEMMVPFPVVFAKDASAAFRSFAFQVRAVVACDKDARLGRHSYEVLCAFEDVSLQVTTPTRWRTESQIAGVQSVLDEIDAKLSGATLQLQVDDRGALRNVDLEGVPTSNERERIAQEGLRQVLSRALSGFHLDLPPHGRASGGWIERDSLLLKMPSSNGVRGFTSIDHTLAKAGGHEIIQSIGGGTVAMQLPVSRSEPADLSPPEPIAPIKQPDTEPKDPNRPKGLLVPPLKYPPPELFETEREMIDPGYSVLSLLESDVLDVEAVYALQHVGVAVFDASLGFVTERVWEVRGDPTASSAGGVQTAPFWSAGRLTLLGPDDHPDLGPSVQLVPETHLSEGLEVWQSLDVL